MTTEQPPTENIPRWAILAGRGRCRVLAYEGNGYFTVLTNRDVKVFTHRDRLTLVKPTTKRNGKTS